jgi:putative FmdB family regulatory protein
MPIYEYQCSKCGHLEIFQRITEKPLERCPTCQRKVTKLISQSSFHLKGSGWYITDYARKGAGDTGGASDKTSSAPDKKSGSDTSKASKAKESSKATGSTESGDKSSSPTKDSGGSTAKESGSSSPASGKMSGAGSAAV